MAIEIAESAEPASSEVADGIFRGISTPVDSIAGGGGITYNWQVSSLLTTSRCCTTPAWRRMFPQVAGGGRSRSCHSNGCAALISFSHFEAEDGAAR